MIPELEPQEREISEGSVTLKALPPVVCSLRTLEFLAVCLQPELGQRQVLTCKGKVTSGGGCWPQFIHDSLPVIQEIIVIQEEVSA